MTPEQIEMAEELGSVVYPIGSFQKRYGRWLSLQAQTNPDRELTERQDAWLRWLVYRYRRQLPKRVVRYACTYGTPEAPRPQMQQRVPKKPIAKDLADRQRETIQRHNDDLRRRGLLPDTT